jgi:hypothetical protein
LRPERLNEYASKERQYIITAIPITMSRFGPSGSSKNRNIVLEHRMDAIPKMRRDVFFDLKCMVSIILVRLWYRGKTILVQ